MKTSIVFYNVLFILSIWLHPATCQHVSDYIIKHDYTTSIARTWGPTYPYVKMDNTHSRKKEIKMATELMIFSVVSTGASLPFFLYYGVSSQPWGGSSFWGSSHTRDVNKTPLYIGGGLFLIGALAGAKSMVLFFKDPVSDKKTTRNKITDNVSIQMTIHPDKAAIYVQF